jgi:hypothetical protein
MKHEDYKTPEPSALMKIFWKAAGADKEILLRSTYSDQIKYVCMGGVVIATGLMAALAGGYAFYTIFEPKGSALDSILLSETGYEQGINKLKDGVQLLNANYQKLKSIKDTSEVFKDSLNVAYAQLNEQSALLKSKMDDVHQMKDNFVHGPTMIISTLFGLIWGLIIFNLDRFIVTSTGKGDGTEAITKQEIKGALPRILMGIIIALTISKPIEIRMFKTEIDVELYKKQKIEKDRFLKNNDSIFNVKAAPYREEIEKLEAGIKLKQDLYLKSETEFNKEMDGGAGARGYGAEAKKKEETKERDYKDYVKTRTRNEAEVAKKEKTIAVYERERDEELAKGDIVAAGLDGLLERITISHEKGGWTSIFIMLLFMAIELTPIFFKLMLIKGPYDFIDENVKELKKAENAIEVEYGVYADKEGTLKDKVIFHQAQRKLELLKAEKEVRDYAVKKWIEKKKSEIDNNLENFIDEK